MLVSKMKIQSVKSPNEARWPYVMGTMYQHEKQYKKAVEAYEEANKRNVSPAILRWVAHCYSEMGLYENALNSIDQALNMDSTDLVNLERKANILYEMGNAKSAIDVYTQVLNTQPEYAFGYYRRGWFKELTGDFDGAIEDLSICVVLDPEESYAFETRGDIYLRQGKKELAEADFLKVIEIENTPEKYSCIHYAYQGLGQYDKAIEMMDSIIAREEDRAGSYYDAACLYSRMDNKQKALEYLEKSLELGYRRFAHIERDQDMDPIRDMEEFKALILKYKQSDVDGSSVRSEVEKSTISSTADISEIPFTKESGVYKVKCQINGEEEVVYLPFGIDLDNLPELKVTGSNEYQARTILRNELVSQIRQLIMSMAPGTAKISEDAVVEFRRKNETMTVDTNNMPKFELKVKEID